MAVLKMVNGLGKVSGLVVVEESEQLIGELIALVDRRQASGAAVAAAAIPAAATAPVVIPTPAAPANDGDGSKRRGRPLKTTGPVAKCRTYLDAHFGKVERADAVKHMVKKLHVKKGTAQAQYQIYKSAHPSVATH